MSYPRRCLLLRAGVAALLLAMCPAPGLAQTWGLALGGSANDSASAAVDLGPSGHLVAGTTRSLGAGGSDGLVVGFDRCGGVVWQATYGGSGDESLLAAGPATGGGALLLGQVEAAGGDQDLWLLRIDGNGGVLWQRTLTRPGDQLARAVTPRGTGFLVAGDSASPGGRSDAWIVEVDGNGNLVAQMALGGGADDRVNDLQATADGGFVLAGYTDGWGAGFYDAWLVKVASDGGLEWQAVYGGRGDDGFEALTELPGGGFAAAGFTDSFGNGLVDAWVMRIDGSGDVVWQITLGGNDDDFAATLAPDDGTWTVGGHTLSGGLGVRDGWLAGVDGTAGSLIWQVGYGGAGDDELGSLSRTAGAGLLAVGGTRSSGQGGEDFWVLRLDGQGQFAGACGETRAISLGAASSSATRVTAGAAVTATAAALTTPGFGVTAQPPGLQVLCAASPSEVSPPGAAVPLRFSAPTQFEWEPAGANCSDLFNLYRGDLGALPGGLACLQPGLGAPTATDTDAPGPALGFVYVVTGSRSAIEGSPGSGAAGSSRLLAPACP